MKINLLLHFEADKRKQKTQVKRNIAVDLKQEGPDSAMVDLAWVKEPVQANNGCIFPELPKPFEYFGVINPTLSISYIIDRHVIPDFFCAACLPAF